MTTPSSLCLCRCLSFFQPFHSSNTRRPLTYCWPAVRLSPPLISGGGSSTFCERIFSCPFMSPLSFCPPYLWPRFCSLAQSCPCPQVAHPSIGVVAASFENHPAATAARRQRNRFVRSGQRNTWSRSNCWLDFFTCCLSGPARPRSRLGHRSRLKSCIFQNHFISFAHTNLSSRCCSGSARATQRKKQKIGFLWSRRDMN